MKIVTIHEAKTHLSRLIQGTLSGEDIWIAKGKTPLVKLTALESAKRPVPGWGVTSFRSPKEFMTGPRMS